MRHRLLVVLLLGGTLLPAVRGQGPTFLGRTVSTWTKELTDGRPAVRRSAAFAIGRLGSEGLLATPELVRCLSDPDAGVRAMAATALGDVVVALRGGGLSAWEAGGPLLAKALTDADARVRGGAAYALGAFGERAAIHAPALRAALRDADARVRRNAAWAVGRLGAEAGGEAVADLCDSLKDADPLVRRDAVHALGAVGAPAARAGVRPLLALVKAEPDEVVRRTALDKLIGLASADDRAVAADLYPLLQTDDADTSRAAAFVLANIGGPEAAPALPVLRQALRDGDDELQSLATAALSNLGPEAAPAVIDLARALTESKNTTVRRNAALALAHIGPKARDAVPLLVRALAPRELREVRMFAAEAIMKIGSPGNDAAVPALLAVVEADPDPTVRHHCAWCVAQRVDHETNGISKVFAKVIEEDDPLTLMLRYEAAWNLAARLQEKAPAKTVDILYDLFRDRRLTGYTGTAVKVSGAGGESSGGQSEVKAVRPAGATSARIEAAKALGWLGRQANRPEIVKALREAQKEDDANLQKAIREALARIVP